MVARTGSCGTSSAERLIHQSRACAFVQSPGSPISRSPAGTASSSDETAHTYQGERLATRRPRGRLRPIPSRGRPEMDRADLGSTRPTEERGVSVRIDVERTSGVEGVTVTDPIASTGLVKTYHQGDEVIHALRGVDLTVARSEFVAITGASGSGKSTLLHIIGGLDRPDEGEVRLEGKRISEMSDEDLSLVRRRRLGFVLQFFNLLPTLSALENAAFPLLLDGRADALDRARSSLGSVGLTTRVDHRPAHLSGGEQQRVALARALVTQPAVVLADEPTGNLDSLTGEDILKLLRTTADAGQTIVMVTHDARSASYADRVLRLVDGSIAEPG